MQILTEPWKEWSVPGIPNLVPQRHGGGIPNWEFSKIFKETKRQARLKISEKLFIYTHKKSTRCDKNVRNNDVTR